MFREKKHLLLILFSFFISSYSFSQIVDGNPENGKTLFDANCTACHYSGPEEMKKIGPGLNSHILEEFSEEWLIKWIRNAPALTNSGDPLAIEVSEYDPSQMQAFTFLKDSQIKDILAYLEQDPTDFEKTGGTAGEEVSAEGVVDGDGESMELDFSTLITIIVVLSGVLILFILINNALRKGLNIEEGFVKGITRVIRDGVTIKILIVFFHIGLVYLLVLGWQSLSKIGITQNYQPDQPIAFSHVVHAGINNIDCNYCHQSARHGKHAGIPSVNVCMNCHSTISEGTNTGKEEIQKIYDAVCWDPIRLTYSDSINQKPCKPKAIEWVQIHSLPDLAYFNHSQHVVVGGLDCKDCHGAVDSMEVVYQQEKLTMGWCIDCHRNTDVNTDNPYYHLYDNLLEKYGVEKLKVEHIGGLECAKCHY